LIDAAHDTLNDAGYWEVVPIGEMSLAPRFQEVKSDSAFVVSQHAHMIRPGETLWDIARQEYHDGVRWQYLYEANKDILPDLQHLPAGAILYVPNADEAPTRRRKEDEGRVGDYVSGDGLLTYNMEGQQLDSLGHVAWHNDKVGMRDVRRSRRISAPLGALPFATDDFEDLYPPGRYTTTGGPA